MKSRSTNQSEVPRQAGWGGMIGVGGDRTNASISFSQRGDTTVNGSAQTHIEGVQLTASSTTNGSITIGAAFNPSNEGPRRGQNYSINYDTDRGQLSGTAGYTDPNSGVGFTTNVDANGVSVSTQYNGINVATVSNNGFQYDEFNWAEQNINLAQDMTGDAERAQKARETLLKKGLTAHAIDSLSPADRESLAESFNEIDDNNRLVSADSIASSALAVIGGSAALFGFMGFAGKGSGSGQTPTNTNANGLVLGRKPKREENGDTDSNPIKTV